MNYYREVFLDLTGSIVILALGLWVLDQLGVERWLASEIGNFIRLVAEAKRDAP